MAADRHAPDLTVPNLPVGGAPAPTFFGAYGQWMGTAPPSWEDVAWLRTQWGGPFMLKGVTRVDDAGGRGRGRDRHLGVQPRRQQPGRNARHDPAAAGHRARRRDQAEVPMDGGVRRGGDVVKALALGRAPS